MINLNFRKLMHSKQPCHSRFIMYIFTSNIICCDFLKISDLFPKITKDNQRLSKTSIEGPKVFRSDKTKLSVLKGTKICHKNDIFTCEDLPVGLVDSFLPGGHLIFIENILQEIQVTDWSTVSTIWNFWEQLLIIVFGHMAQKVKYDKAQSINVSWCSCDLVTYTNTNLSWSCRDTRQCHLCCCTDVCVPFVLDCILLLLC